MRSNNSFKPKLLRYTKGMAGKACHAFGSTTQFGLTQALGLMFKCNRIPKIALLVLLLAFAYLAVLILLGQERAMDWGLSSEEMYLHEKLLSLAAAAGGIATWLLGMYRAHLQGSWWWFIACMFLWPVAFVYTLVFNTGREA